MMTVTMPSSLALVPYIHIYRLVVELQRSRVYTFPPLRLPRAICRHDTVEYQVGWTRGHSADQRDGARATG